jgi:hypothetical protein
MCIGEKKGEGGGGRLEKRGKVLLYIEVLDGESYWYK